MQEHETQLNIVIPTELYKQIKMRAAYRNIKIKDWVVRAILEAIKEEQKYE